MILLEHITEMRIDFDTWLISLEDDKAKIVIFVNGRKHPTSAIVQEEGENLVISHAFGRNIVPKRLYEEKKSDFEKALLCSKTC